MQPPESECPICAAPCKYAGAEGSEYFYRCAKDHAWKVDNEGRSIALLPTLGSEMDRLWKVLNEIGVDCERDKSTILLGNHCYFFFEDEKTFTSFEGGSPMEPYEKGHASSVTEAIQKYVTFGPHDEREVENDGAAPWGVGIDVPNDPTRTIIALTGHDSKQRAIESRDRITQVLELVFLDMLEDLGFEKK